MPFSSDRLRLGYFCGCTWGGDHIFPKATTVPGMQLDWDAEAVAPLFGAKSRRMTFATRNLESA